MRSESPFVPPFILLVTAVIVAVEISLHKGKILFCLKNQKALSNGYLETIKSGFETQYSPMNFENHPCFSEHAKHKVGRIHLPVAPKCNIQCNFCNRKYDCVNENRPGVTQQVYTPTEAMAVLDQLFKQRSDISVVGIAGPGDPLCEPKNTLATLQEVRRGVRGK